MKKSLEKNRKSFNLRKIIGCRFYDGLFQLKNFRIDKYDFGTLN